MQMSLTVLGREALEASYTGTRRKVFFHGSVSAGGRAKADVVRLCLASAQSAHLLLAGRGYVRTRTRARARGSWCDKSAQPTCCELGGWESGWRDDIHLQVQSVGLERSDVGDGFQAKAFARQ
jgi:hypothetical protein